MPLKLTLSVALVALCVSACASEDQINARYRAQCAARGFAYDTPEMEQCRVALVEARKAGDHAALQSITNSVDAINSRPPVVNCTVRSAGQGVAVATCQ